MLKHLTVKYEKQIHVSILNNSREDISVKCMKIVKIILNKEQF